MYIHIVESTTVDTQATVWLIHNNESASALSKQSTSQLSKLDNEFASRAVH